MRVGQHIGECTVKIVSSTSLPATLHRESATLAQREQTSLNQDIVSALTRQVTSASPVPSLPEEEVSSQQERFHPLLQELGHTSAEEGPRF